MIFGDSPFGSTPFADNGGSSVAGVNYTPGTATITFEGFAPIALYNFLPSRVYAEYVEVLHPGVSASRVYSEYAEVLHPGVSSSRVYAEYVEVLRSIADAAPTGDDGFVFIIW